MFKKLCDKNTKDKESLVNEIGIVNKKYCIPITEESNSFQTNFINSLNDEKIDALIKEIQAMKEENPQPNFEKIIEILRKINSLEKDLEKKHEFTKFSISKLDEHQKNVEERIREMNLDFISNLKNN